MGLNIGELTVCPTLGLYLLNLSFVCIDLELQDQIFLFQIRKSDHGNNDQYEFKNFYL